MNATIDRRLLLMGLGAAALPTASLAAPRDWPAVQAFLDEYVGGKRLANCVVGILRQGSRPDPSIYPFACRRERTLSSRNWTHAAASSRVAKTTRVPP